MSAENATPMPTPMARLVKIETTATTTTLIESTRLTLSSSIEPAVAAHD